MRLLLALTLAMVFAAAPTAAQTIAQHSCDASYAALNDRDKGHIDYKSFIANCEQTRQGWEQPQSQIADPGLAHITGLCADNSYTTAMTRTDACLNDGGVTAWFVGNYAPAPISRGTPGCDGDVCPTVHQAPVVAPKPPSSHQPPPAPETPPTTPVS